MLALGAAAAILAFPLNKSRPPVAIQETYGPALLNPAPLIEAIANTDFEALEDLREQLSPARIVRTLEVGRGDTLMKLLTGAGIERDDSHQAIAALRKFYDPRRLQLGQEITLTLEAAGERAWKLAGLDLADGVERAVTVTRADSGFAAQEIVHEFERGFTRAAGTVTSNLYDAAMEAGIPLPILTELIRLFSYDVDFQRELQPGDSFEVFFERFADDAGKPVKTGRMLAASMTLRGQDLRYYLYTPPGGEPDYFSDRGQSVRKALLRTPIDGARLTSSFGMRAHPILGFNTMHKGVDFGAPSGTPIQAAGDGIVESAGPNGAYGNYIRLKHTGTYGTAYAHLSRLAVKRGERVRQGQTIGYVGSTGRSTGPHLHYEVLMNGAQINPVSVRFPNGRRLEGKELAGFRRAIEEIETRIAGTPAQHLLAENR